MIDAQVCDCPACRAAMCEAALMSSCMQRGKMAALILWKMGAVFAKLARDAGREAGRPS